MCSLTSMGANSPEALSSMGYMEVQDHQAGETHTGTLLSDGLPNGDLYEVGTTYNASQIRGVQAVVTAEETVELDGEFTVTNATNDQGESMEEVVYRNVTYETTDMEGYQDLMENLTERQSEIESRQQDLRSSGGGGGWDLGVPDLFGGFLAGVGSVVSMLVVVLVAVFLIRL
jgi:hypothetical protein